MINVLISVVISHAFKLTESEQTGIVETRFLLHTADHLQKQSYIFLSEFS